MSWCRRFIESLWQTTKTRVPRGCLAFAAEASERIFGTAPPAAGATLLSAFGSGQYAVRSTCASADAASSEQGTTTASAAAAVTLPRTFKRILPLRLRAAANVSPLRAHRAGRRGGISRLLAPARQRCQAADRGRAARVSAAARPSRRAG